MRVVEQVRIASVAGDRARIEILKPADPSSCGKCSQAGLCSSSPGGQRSITVRGLGGAPEGVPLKVELDLPSPAWAAFVLFMVPMAAGFAAGGLAYHLSRSGTIGLLGGVAGIALCYLGVYLSGHSSLPLARLVDEEGAGVD